ncbi:MAG: chaperone modulatory protein CbpM [Gammaproteobacteria bacterium]|nr:chaperone modulatory protein CbpM [bacterium AH-315-E07]PCH60345.1 MAG: chaperone modulatory protein CbpM [Gammaproteobacteria bacterium]
MTDDSLTAELTLKEVCEIADMPTEVLITIVEEGVLEPSGALPNEWSFDIYMLSIAKRAARLHRDFDIEWASIPLCLDLIEELEKLRSENKSLKQRLQRFSQE